MKVFVVFFAVFAVASSQRFLTDLRPVDYNVPIPYSFSYVAPGEEGQSSHQETGDGNGRVQGSYSLSDVDGRSRVVEYVADEGGFRAIVRTNEPGTANQNPADVVVESSAPEVAPTGPVAPVIRSVPIRPTTRLVGRPSGGVRYVLVPVRA